MVQMAPLVSMHMHERFCSSFKSICPQVCPLAGESGGIATTSVNPKGVSVFVACHLVPLNKFQSVGLIGVGEVPRSIIAKAILKTTGGDVEKAAGPLQLCAGQDGGCEAAVHVIQNIFQAPETEAVLLADANNAFNLLNRKAVLHNIDIIFPSLAQTLINTYRAPVRLFITGSDEVSSMEGTTQGNPLAMAMYALAARAYTCTWPLPVECLVWSLPWKKPHQCHNSTR